MTRHQDIDGEDVDCFRRISQARRGRHGHLGGDRFPELAGETLSRAVDRVHAWGRGKPTACFRVQKALVS